MIAEPPPAEYDPKVPLVIDAARGLVVRTVARFPWPRRAFLHDGNFQITPAEIVCSTRLLIYVHGYNEDPEIAKGYGLHNIAAGVSERGEICPVATFLWPSRFGVLGFGRARRAANATAPVFAKAVEHLRAQCPALRLHVLAHSLGARVVLKALQENPLPVVDLALVAPAVDSDALEPGGEFGAVAGRVARILYTHNRFDRSLRWYRWRGSRALGAHGFEHPDQTPSNVSGVDMAADWQAHSRDGGHGAILHPQYWPAFWKKALPKDFFQ